MSNDWNPPKWTTFPEDDYKQPDWDDVYIDDVMCEQSVRCDCEDCENLAHLVVAHRYEIVHLRRQLREARKEKT